ncbi:MAG: TIGR04282 family arsenosugar biosynthesis glycosyltransferase, partial [Pacificimonas sp.]
MTETLRPIVFARYPEAGQCKTRMIPAVGAEGAADLHQQLVERTLDRLADLSPEVAYTGADEVRFRDWLGPDVRLFPQADGDLGERMLGALFPGPALVVGSDIPDISEAAVCEAIRLLEEQFLVLGPADDGGFWLVGMQRPLPRLFDNIDWGSDRVLAQVTANAHE